MEEKIDKLANIFAKGLSMLMDEIEINKENNHTTNEVTELMNCWNNEVDKIMEEYTEFYNKVKNKKSTITVEDLEKHIPHID